jgi:4-amino-4-deoxy-L-arabinose transferase-like glycosyltransferase
MRRILIVLVKILAALLIALAVWFPFGGIMWQSQSRSGSGVEPKTQPVGQSYLGSVVFAVFFIVALYFLFRRRRQRKDA